MATGFALAAILAAVLVPAQTPSEEYAWPLDLPRELTSSFAEYRPGRYHMGIDLRTGPIGKDVFAAADGYVSRIRCSPYGYGKAVYLQLEDGNSAVYAHLDDFAPALRDYVRRAQHEREEYTVDLTPKPGEFRVKKGELIAKSGQTGIGVPHLHYELRDNEGVPINPRLLGVTWPDETAPTIESAVIVPLTPKSRVNGHFRPARFSYGIRRGPQNPVAVAGAFGVAISVQDSGVNKSRLGIRRAKVSSGDQEIFTVQNDRVSYDHTEDAAAAFLALEQGPAGVQYLALWRDPGNDSEAYKVSRGDGAFVLTQPIGVIAITVEDFAGNTTTVEVPIRNGAGAPPSQAGAPGGGFTLEYTGRALHSAAQFKPAQGSLPDLVIEGSVTTRIPMERYAEQGFAATWLPDEAFADVNVYVDYSTWQSTKHHYAFVRRGAPAQEFSFDALRVETLPDSPYGTLGFNVEERGMSGGDELITLGTAYHLGTMELPVDAPITISLPLPAGEAGERAFFYRRGKERWNRIDTTRAKGRASAAVKQLGSYALFDDATPSAVEFLRLSDNKPLKTPLLSIRTGAIDPPPVELQTATSRRPRIRAQAADGGSGIEAWRVTYNGRWLLTGYDPEQDLLTWEQDEDLPTGPGTLVIEVRDYSGNLTRQEVAFSIPG